VSLSSILAFAAAAFSGMLALAVILHKRRSVASWCFSDLLAGQLQGISNQVAHCFGGDLFDAAGDGVVGRLRLRSR
jgi:hypothetical protein